MLTQSHSRPQRPRSFRSTPKLVSSLLMEDNVQRSKAQASARFFLIRAISSVGGHFAWYVRLRVWFCTRSCRSPDFLALFRSSLPVLFLFPPSLTSYSTDFHRCDSVQRASLSQPFPQQPSKHLPLSRVPNSLRGPDPATPRRSSRSANIQS